MAEESCLALTGSDEFPSCRTVELLADGRRIRIVVEDLAEGAAGEEAADGAGAAVADGGRELVRLLPGLLACLADVAEEAAVSTAFPVSSPAVA